jgi:hypothetical protein
MHARRFQKIKAPSVHVIQSVGRRDPVHGVFDLCDKHRFLGNRRQRRLLIAVSQWIKRKMVFQ